MTFKQTMFAVIAAATLLSAPLIAATVRVGNLAISGAWSRESASGQSVGGAFMTIANVGPSDDRLLGGSSPVAAQVQLHTMSMEGGVMRMRQVQGGLAIPARGNLELKPGGFHIMFIGLKQPLTLGAKPEYSLKFAKAGTIKVACNVQTPPAAPMPGMDHMNHGAGGQ